jgi:CheY-like chemotaxis protein
MHSFLMRLVPETIAMRLDLAEELPAVRIDPGHFEQVIMNLVVNACDAMPNGGALVLCTGSTASAAGSRDVTITVRDTGCGMNRETVDRMFEPFFTTKELERGTGLGLSTVHGIVQQAGGSIGVESAPGVGTTITLRFPACESEPIPTAPTQRSIVYGGGGETILLCEDEFTVRRLMALALTDRGYRVLEAGSGKEALSLAERHQGAIDLLVTDVIMPEMNGKTLAESLLEESPATRVLFVSGYTDEVLSHHGQLLDRSALLEKPFTAEDLARRVGEVLGVG